LLFLFLQVGEAGKTGVAKNDWRLKWEKQQVNVKQAREKKRVGF